MQEMPLILLHDERWPEQICSYINCEAHLNPTHLLTPFSHPILPMILPYDNFSLGIVCLFGRVRCTLMRDALIHAMSGADLSNMLMHNWLWVAFLVHVIWGADLSEYALIKMRGAFGTYSSIHTFLLHFSYCYPDFILGHRWMRCALFWFHAKLGLIWMSMLVQRSLRGPFDFRLCQALIYKLPGHDWRWFERESSCENARCIRILLIYSTDTFLSHDFLLNYNLMFL